MVLMVALIVGPKLFARAGWPSNHRPRLMIIRNEYRRALTLPPGIKHWFQSPVGGAMFHGFFTCVRHGLNLAPVLWGVDRQKDIAARGYLKNGVRDYPLDLSAYVARLQPLRSTQSQ